MSCFSKLIYSSPQIKSAVIDINKHRFPFGLLGLPPAVKNSVIHTLCEITSHGALVLTPDEATALRCVSDLEAYGTRAVCFPERDFNFQNVAGESPEYEQKRIGALTQKLLGQADVIVCSVGAAMQRTVPPQILQSRLFSLKPEQTAEPAEIAARLVQAGYSRCDLVEGAGQFSIRGDILDVFPSNLEHPVRIEFFGDEIDSISEFDVLSQRRMEQTEGVTIPPCSEVLFDSFESFVDILKELKKNVRGKQSEKIKEWLSRDISLAESGIKPGSMDKYISAVYDGFFTVLDYCTQDLLFVYESGTIKNNALNNEKIMNEELTEQFYSGNLCKGLDSYQLSFALLCERYDKGNTVYIDNFVRGSFDTPVKDLINFNVNQSSKWDGSYSVLMEDIEPCLKNRYTAVIFAGTEHIADALCRDIQEDGFPCVYHKIPPAVFQTGYVNIIPGSVSGGADWPGERFIVITYGRDVKSTRRTVKKIKKSANAFNSLEELHQGDYVVHQDHGIGIFDGINKMEFDGVTKDYIKILYAKGDVLYISVTQLELLSKYIGPHEDDENRTVKLNRLGSGDWEKTKQRVKGAVKDIAEQLIKIYAKRQTTPGYPFSPDIDMQSDFERRFEYDETDDQLRCIDEIKQDMEKSCPMDRLLCGDVGFGKTEVALRAAFKCVCDGKQVAILVPTTILALQHYRTVLHRFEGFPIETEMLCRFRTPKQQKEIINRVKMGSLDVLVGTHRIISKDVEFKDLGLLIVDEEQRFGVQQKEKLKEKFPAVDVLTLSATPIPRTMNFAMMGLRDLSTLEEAPNDRFPIQTYVVEQDMGIISGAIAKELRRGGQVYYLHNRIDDIEKVAAKLQNLFPDATVAIGHGKMSEGELSSVWKSLLEGETDILVSTTIIETGVDVPNVNTIIIENADRMGLSQLHQLRGRVGRSSRRAFAYLTYGNDNLSEIAQKRLNAIREFTQFGAGFKIAMRDLEIRGAGDMLGAHQSGHIDAVGYDMYLKLLSEAVEQIKQGEEAYVPKTDCRVDIHIDAHIPDSYIASYSQRIAVYKRIADIHTNEDALDVTDELIDRYSEPPQCVLGLIKVALLKNSAADNGICEIKQKAGCLLFYVKKIDPDTVAGLSVLKGRLLVNNSVKPYYSVRLDSKQKPLECIEEVIKLLSRS